MKGTESLDNLEKALDDRPESIVNYQLRTLWFYSSYIKNNKLHCFYFMTYSNLTNDGVPLIADLGALMLKTPDCNDFSVAGMIDTF